MMNRKFSALLTGTAAAAFTLTYAFAATAAATSPTAGAYKAPLNAYGQIGRASCRERV